MYNVIETLMLFGANFFYFVTVEDTAIDIIFWTIPTSVPFIGGWSIFDILLPATFSVYVGYIFIKWVLDIVF